MKIVPDPESVFYSPKNRLFLFGHRGFSAIAPENTLPAFQALLDHNIPGVELDVQICRSGELVVIHDDSLKRTTGCPTFVGESDYDQIRSLDAGSWFGKTFRGERIPLLDDVFDLLRDRAYYDIELKCKKRKTGIIEERVLARIKDHGLRNLCLISSFNPFIIRRVRRLDPIIPTALIYADHQQVPLLLRHGEGFFLCNSPYIKPAHRQIHFLSTFIYKSLLKSNILAWTIDEPERAERLLQSGIRGIISNNPGYIKNALKVSWFCLN